MQNSLYCHLKLTARAVTAAGVLTLTASGQEFPLNPVGPVGHIHPPAAVRADQDGRLAEIKTELAWLADPAVFPCRLIARADGSTLEVRGFVPHEAIREQALKLAREHSGLSVVDALQVHRGLAPRTSVGRDPQEVKLAAVEALKRTLPEAADAISVQVRPGGQVILDGVVPSHEDRLLASQCQRKVNGCTSVLNRLEVATSAASPNPPTLARHEPLPAGPATATQQPMSRPSPESLSAVEVSPPLPMASPPAMEQPAAPVVPTPSQPLRPLHLKEAVDPAVRPIKAEQTVAPRPRVPEPQMETPPRPSGPALVPVATRKQPEPAMRPTPAVVSASPAPAAVAKTVPSQPGAPYVTTGVVLIEGLDLPLEGTPPAATDLNALAAQMRQKIEATFGDQVKGVQVRAISPTSLEVRVKARDAAEGHRLSQALFKMPELRPYQVTLDVDLVP